MQRIAARAGLLLTAAACLLPAAGCSSLMSSAADCREHGCFDTCCDTSKCCRCCCGTCCYSNRAHTLYDPCTRSCFGVPYSGGQCTCWDDCKDRVNQISDIILP